MAVYTVLFTPSSAHGTASIQLVIQELHPTSIAFH
jgi:hypothetical protein